MKFKLRILLEVHLQTQWRQKSYYVRLLAIIQLKQVTQIMGSTCAGSKMMVCQRCGISGNAMTMKTHLCQPKNNYGSQQGSDLKQQTPTPAPKKDIFMPFLRPVFPPVPDKYAPKLYHGQAKDYPSEQVTVKVPANSEQTQFKWVKENTVVYPTEMKKFKADVIRHRTFQQKMLWFRLNMEDMRISWQNGCANLRVDRGNIIYSSLFGLEKVDLHKELKIIFDDEVVSDAGGLLRQWMHLIIEEIFKPETGIFELCNTDETAYKIVWDQGLSFDYAAPYLKLLGIIIGKALFERVSLNCYLNRSIWRQISGYTVFLHDVYSFDKELNKSWNMILNQKGSQNLYLEFYEVKSHSNGVTEEIELVRGGKNITVNDVNKDQYIFQMVQLYCNRSIKIFIEALMEGLHSVVPANLLSVFQPYEFQMLLNGPQEIDVRDWKANTTYKGYKQSDQQIVWFWQVVGKYNQEMLANLLHYCTGSNRVPILGFKYLESNRNTINKFTIERVKCEKYNPYPRSYTCFNRMQLPEYKTYKQLEEKLTTVISQKITHFGLD